MKALILALVLLATSIVASAQKHADPSGNSATALQAQGLKLFTADDNAGAALAYEQALALEPNNFVSLTGLMYCYNALSRDAEAVVVGEKMVKINPNATATAFSYYGLALNHLGRTKEAEKVYGEGARLYPEAFALHFNRGVNLLKLNEPVAAGESFQTVVLANPQHAKSHYNIGFGRLAEGARIAGVLAVGRCLAVDASDAKDAARREVFDAALLKGSTLTEHGVVFNISKERIDAAQARDRGGDDFSNIDQELLTVSASLAASSNAPTNRVERANRLFSTLCKLLSARPAAERKGFVWDYYAPYFIEMEKKDFVPAFIYVAHTSQTEVPEVQQWLAAHATEVEAFQEWSKKYLWPKSLH